MKLKLIHLVGLVQLIIAIICCCALAIMQLHGIYPQELTVLYLQMACSSTGFLCSLLALESTVLISREKRGFRNALIFDIITSVVLAIVLFITARDFATTYLGDTILGSELELWDESVLSWYTIGYKLAISASILLLLIVPLLSISLYKSIRQT